MIPAASVAAARHVADQVRQAGVRIVSHEYVRYQGGRVFHRLTVARPDFTQANCAGLDTELFYPEPTADNFSLAADPFVDRSESVFMQARYATRVCESCPVIDACREYAVAAGEYGVWGGTTHSQRKNIRSERQQMVSPTAMFGESDIGTVVGVVGVDDLAGVA